MRNVILSVKEKKRTTFDEKKFIAKCKVSNVKHETDVSETIFSFPKQLGPKFENQVLFFTNSK